MTDTTATKATTATTVTSAEASRSSEDDTHSEVQSEAGSSEEESSPENLIAPDEVESVDESSGAVPDESFSSEISSAAEPQKQYDSLAEQALSMLSLREKVGQVFMLRMDGLLFNDNRDHAVRYMSDYFQRCVANYPIGGFIAMGDNIVNAEQITELNRSISSLYCVKPFLCTDEEGGTVARIANSGAIDVPKFPSNSVIAEGGDPGKAFELGKTIGGYLKEYGFDLDLAPVADVNTNPLNIVIGSRAFGSDPQAASGYVSAVVDGLHESGVMSCLKHFPGHGDTAEDTHYMTASVNKTWEEMKQCELIPFIGSLDKTDMVMAAHIIAPEVTGDHTPASLSYTLLTEKLRNELGYDGVIITDGLAMKAVSDIYSPEEACIQSFLAGADILLAPNTPYECYEAMIAAVENGAISEERLNESVMRILRLKEKYGMIKL